MFLARDGSSTTDFPVVDCHRFCSRNVRFGSLADIAASLSAAKHEKQTLSHRDNGHPNKVPAISSRARFDWHILATPAPDAEIRA
jgi:hypothetical protein